MIPASMVSSPVAVIRTRKLLLPLFTVPPITCSPGPFFTGLDSPVNMDSLSSLSPSKISPSAGTFAPGRISTISPGRSAARGTSSTVPSSRTRSAVAGNNFTNSSNARDACRTLRISIQCPNSMTSINVTSSQKKLPASGRKSAARLYTNATLIASEMRVIMPGRRWRTSGRAICKKGTPPYKKIIVAKIGDTH